MLSQSQLKEIEREIATLLDHFPNALEMKMGKPLPITLNVAINLAFCIRCNQIVYQIMVQECRSNHRESWN